MSFSLPPLLGSGGLTLSCTDVTQFYFIFADLPRCYLWHGAADREPAGHAFRSRSRQRNRAVLIGINVYLTGGSRLCWRASSPVSAARCSRCSAATPPLLHVLPRVRRSRGLGHRRRRRHAVRAAGRNRAAHPLSRVVSGLWEHLICSRSAPASSWSVMFAPTRRGRDRSNALTSRRIGRRTSKLHQRSHRQTRESRVVHGQPSFRIRGLTKRFGGLIAVDDVSVEFPEGRAQRRDRAEWRRQDHAFQSRYRHDPGDRRPVIFRGHATSPA